MFELNNSVILFFKFRISNFIYNREFSQSSNETRHDARHDILRNENKIFCDVMSFVLCVDAENETNVYLLIEIRGIINTILIYFDEFTFSLANYLVRGGTISRRGVSRLVACAQITSREIRRPWSAWTAHIASYNPCIYPSWLIKKSFEFLSREYRIPRRNNSCESKFESKLVELARKIFERKITHSFRSYEKVLLLGFTM